MNLRLPEETLDEIVEIAKKERRTVSEVVRKLIAEALAVRRKAKT